MDGTRHILSSSPEYHRTTGVLLYEPGEGLSGETEEEGDIGAWEGGVYIHRETPVSRLWGDDCCLRVTWAF